MMLLLAAATVRSTMILLVGLAACALLRGRSASLRHAVLAGAIVAAGAVGPLAAVLPVWHIPVWQVPAAAVLSVETQSSASMPAAASASARPESRSAPAARSGMSLVAVVWTGGFALTAASLLVGLTRLRRVARRARPVDCADWLRITSEVHGAYRLRRPVTLLQTEAPDVLATFGLRRPRVLLPRHSAGWSEDRIHAVLCHELAHVGRHDWAIQMAAEAVRALYWFNPLMWIACSWLRRESEQACDDAVLERGVAPREYARHLLALARLCRRPRLALSAVPIARPSTLERRITAMLNPALNRRAASRGTLAVLATLLATVTFAAAALRAGQAAPAPLAGSVYDPTGAVLPGVRLTLEDAQQGKVEATTDGSGRFEFPAVAPGRYVLEASVPGFRTLRQELDLQTTRDWDRAITLQVGELRETITVQATRTSAAGAAQTAAPIRVGGNLRVPRKLHDVRPVYPASMRDAGREGVVPMEALIGRDGDVTSVRVVSADVHPDFAIAAADAVRQWRFAPTLLNGEPVEVRMSVSVQFTLAQ